MSHRQGISPANAMVGVYFGIFAACLAAGVVLLLIFEQLGVTDASLKTAMVAISVILFATIGAGAYTGRIREFLLSGRRVPAVYNGVALAVVALGAAGTTGIAGVLFLAGFDMLCIGVGIVAGLSVSVMLLAIAEIKIGLMSVMWLLPLSPEAAGGVIGLVLALTVLPGGVRSLSWSGAAQAMAVLIAILLPAAIAAVMQTNLPFGQFSHGPIIRAVARLETAQDVPIPVASLMALDIPGSGLQPIVGRFSTTFGSVGQLAYVLLTLSILVGTAGSPALLSRAVTTPSVYDTRKSIGWAVAIVGILLLTFSSVAIFERDILVGSFVGQSAADPPAALRRLMDIGLAALDGQGGRLNANSILFDRDGMLVALPVMMGMPLAVVNLVAAGVMAAALTGAATSLTQLGIMLGEDVAAGPSNWAASDRMRVMVCRLAIVGAIAVAGVGAVATNGDPLVLMLYAILISGSTIFPVLLLSIWWKRLTVAGAIACLVTGLFTTLAVLLADLASLGIPALLAPVIALPAALIAAGIASYLTPGPGRHILEMVRDLRIPGGETIYDREMRQARQRGQRSR
jgi:cation/acetate symporter